MSDVTRILSQIEQGDPQAAEKLLPLVYDELLRLGGEASRLLHATGTAGRSSASLWLSPE
jgi:ECF sigma factor